MRGYLRHIAAKVTGGPAAVRPRVPSLFEPAKDFVSSPFKQALRRERIAVDTSWGSVDQELDAMPNTPPRMTMPQPHEPLTTTTTNTRQQKDKAPEAPSVTAETPSVQTLPTTKIFETRKPLRPTASIQPQKPIEARVQAQPSKQILHDKETGEISRPQPSRLRTEIAPENAEKRPSERKGLRVESAKDKVERPQETQSASSIRATNQAALDNAVTAILSGARTTIAPQLVMNESKASNTVPLAATPTQPSVQVVIGRVIVEAITPPAAPAPMPMRGPTPPKLSLEDYLRERRA